MLISVKILFWVVIGIVGFGFVGCGGFNGIVVEGSVVYKDGIFLESGSIVFDF